MRKIKNNILKKLKLGVEEIATIEIDCKELMSGWETLKEKIKNLFKKITRIKNSAIINLTKLKEKIWHWFYFESFIIKIYDNICRFIEWIVRCVQFSIFLWDQHDFDFSYLLTLMQYKVSRMRKCIKNYGHLESCEEVCKEMEVFEQIIETYFNADHTKKEQKVHDKKWGEQVQEFDEQPIVLKNGVTVYQWDPKRKNATTKKLHNQERKEQMKIYELDSKRQMESFYAIFDYLKDHLLRWWD